MSDRATSQLPLPSETSHITRRRPSQPLPLPTTPEQPQQTLHQHTCNSPSCAAAKVLSTPELLENTLAHLPTKSILSLRHVSKTWHSLITTSPSLRLHLFNGTVQQSTSNFYPAPPFPAFRSSEANQSI